MLLSVQHAKIAKAQHFVRQTIILESKTQVKGFTNKLIYAKYHTKYILKEITNISKCI